MRKKILLVSCFIICASLLSAQGIDNVNNALQETTTQVKGMFTYVKVLVYAIAAVLAIVNAVKAFNAFQAGDQDASKKAGIWFGGAVFLGIAVFFAEKLFLNN